MSTKQSSGGLVLALVAASWLALGCAPTPKKICDHTASVRERDAKTKPTSEEVAKKYDACVADLTKMQSDYPDAYKCMTTCTKLDTGMALGLCQLDCVTKDPKLKADEEAKRKKRDEERELEERKKADWSSRTLSTVSARTGGVSLSLQAPEGAKKTESEEYASFTDEALGLGPSVTIRVSPFGVTGDDGYAEAIAKAANKVLAKKQKLADGFLSAMHGPDKESLEVRVTRKLGKKTLECRAAQSGIKGGIPNFEKQLDAFEKICLSLKAI